MKIISNCKKMNGQVVLMVLLASTLILTLGLSAAKQATVETKIDTDQELLRDAFNMAESGIGYYLKTSTTEYGDINSASGGARLVVNDIGNTQTFTYGNVILANNMEYFWLVGHQDDGKLDTDYYVDSDNMIDVCASAGKSGLFKINYFYRKIDNSGFGMVETLQAIDPATDCVSLSLAAGQPVLIAVSPINFSSTIEIRGSEVFPIQGKKIAATGIISGVNNTVTVLSRYEFPTFLLDAITSGDNVTNN